MEFGQILAPPLAIVVSVYIAFLFVVLLLPQLYPVTAQTLDYAPFCIGAISTISVVGWIFPKYGGKYWFDGPIKTITDEELRNGRIEGGDRRASIDEYAAAEVNTTYGARTLD